MHAQPWPRWGWVLNVMPQLLYPHPRDPVPTVQEDGCGPWSWSGQCGNLTPPLGFEPQTILPIASYYTNYAILAVQKLLV